MKFYRIVVLCSALALLFVGSVYAQDEAPPACPTDTDPPVGCPVITLADEGLVGDFYLGDTLLAQGAHSANLQVPASTTQVIDVRNISDGSDLLGITHRYADGQATVWLRPGQTRAYTVTTRQIPLVGAVQVTCDIRQAVETDDVACQVAFDEQPVPDLFPPGAVANLLLDPGTHVITVRPVGSAAHLWAPESNTHTVQVTAGVGRSIRSTFNKAAHLLVALDTPEVLADILINGELAAEQVAGYEAWLEPNKTYRIQATNFSDPNADDTFTYRDANASTYLRPGDEKTVELALTRQYTKGFLEVSCEITNYAGEDVYCQPYIDGEAAEPVVPGGSQTYNLEPGRHEARVVLAPETVWYSSPTTSTPYIRAGQTTRLRGTFTLMPDVPPGAEMGRVTRVVDGDTIDVRLGDRIARVDYIGVEAPASGQECASGATSANRALVSGKDVVLVADALDADANGNLLRYVYVGDTFVNGELISQGAARAHEQAPNLAQATVLADREAQARSAGLGCWSTSVWACQPGERAAYVENFNDNSAQGWSRGNQGLPAGWSIAPGPYGTPALHATDGPSDPTTYARNISGDYRLEFDFALVSGHAFAAAGEWFGLYNSGHYSVVRSGNDITLSVDGAPIASLQATSDLLAFEAGEGNEYWVDNVIICKAQ